MKKQNKENKLFTIEVSKTKENLIRLWSDELEIYGYGKNYVEAMNDFKSNIEYYKKYFFIIGDNLTDKALVMKNLYKELS